MYQSKNTVTYDNALTTLHSMFSDYDRETIATILESNNYQVERTIECLLSMGANVKSEKLEPNKGFPFNQ